MKTMLLLIIVLLAVPGLIWAQHCDSIDNHRVGFYVMFPQS